MIEKLTTNYSKVVMLICDNAVKFDNKRDNAHKNLVIIDNNI